MSDSQAALKRRWRRTAANRLRNKHDGIPDRQPVRQPTVATFDDLTDEQLTTLITQAQRTFESWSQKSFAERAAVCGRAAAILTERPDEFARLLTLEMGKLYDESLEKWR